jgi:hypothetical protein
MSDILVICFLHQCLHKPKAEQETDKDEKIKRKIIYEQNVYTTVGVPDCHDYYSLISWEQMQ